MDLFSFKRIIMEENINVENKIEDLRKNTLEKKRVKSNLV